MVNNASYLAGWQTAAIAANLFPDPCNFSQPYYARWAEFGLNAGILQTVLCSRAGCDILDDYANQFAHFFRYISAIFTQELTYAFLNYHYEFGWFCDYLDPRCMTNLTGTNDTQQAMCDFANGSITPLTFPGNGSVPISEFNFLVGNASVLLAWEILGGLSDPSALADMCSSFGSFASFAAKAEAAGLHPDAMQPILCTNQTETQLVPTETSWCNVQPAASYVFAITLYNANQNYFWKEWVCNGYNTTGSLPYLDSAGMKAVNLLEDVVTAAIIERCRADDVPDTNPE